jgi:hypothetical protein
VEIFNLFNSMLAEFWSVALDPSPNRHMVDRKVPLRNDFLEISIAEREPEVPADAQNDNLGLEVSPFEQRRPARPHHITLSNRPQPTLQHIRVVSNGPAKPHLRNFSGKIATASAKPLRLPLDGPAQMLVNTAQPRPLLDLTRVSLSSEVPTAQMTEDLVTSPGT